MATRFTRRGVSKFLFSATSAAGDPTRANITGATDLTVHIADSAGWQLENQAIPVPDMGSAFEKNIPGSDQAADSSFTFYEDLDAETLETLLAKGTAGFVFIMRKGDKPTTPTLDKFPVRVAVKAAEYSTGNDPARFRVGFTITETPKLDCVIPALV